MKPQIATTSDQSARLLACGVKPETADMYLSINLNEGENYGKYSTHILRKNKLSMAEIMGQRDYQPAWSLSALLALLPKEIYDENDDMYYMRLSQCFPFTDEYATEYVPAWFEGKELVRKRDNNPIEACVQLIEWLTSNGYSLNNIDE